MNRVASTAKNPTEPSLSVSCCIHWDNGLLCLKKKQNTFTWSLTSLTTVKQKAFNKKPVDLNWEFLVCQRWRDFLVTWSSKCNLLIFCRLGKQGFIYTILHLRLSYTKLRIIFLPSFSQQYSNKAFKSLLPYAIIYSWAKRMQVLLLQFTLCYSKPSLWVQITYECETTEQVLDCHFGKKCSTRSAVTQDYLQSLRATYSFSL